MNTYISNIHFCGDSFLASLALSAFFAWVFSRDSRGVTPPRGFGSWYGPLLAAVLGCLGWLLVWALTRDSPRGAFLAVRVANGTISWVAGCVSVCLPLLLLRLKKKMLGVALLACLPLLFASCGRNIPADAARIEVGSGGGASDGFWLTLQEIGEEGARVSTSIPTRVPGTVLIGEKTLPWGKAVVLQGDCYDYQVTAWKARNGERAAHIAVREKSGEAP